MTEPTLTHLATPVAIDLLLRPTYAHRRRATSRISTAVEPNHTEVLPAPFTTAATYPVVETSPLAARGDIVQLFPLGASWGIDIQRASNLSSGRGIAKRYTDLTEVSVEITVHGYRVTGKAHATGPARARTNSRSSIVAVSA